MKIKILEPVEYDAEILRVDAGVWYWEDGTINGEKDNSEFPNMPFSENGRWKIDIDIDRGQIIDWPKGIEASVHYKVCDDGIYEIVDSTGVTIFRCEDRYVPDVLAPGNYSGVYIIMNIDEEGCIHNWDNKLIKQLVEYEEF